MNHEGLPLGDRLTDALVSQGLTRAFGLLGAGILRPVARLTRHHGLPYTNAAHENVAISMADGYARASGDTGVVMLAGGPALTNGLTSLVTARRASSPLLIVSPVVEPTTPNPFESLQALDQRRVLESVGVEMVEVGPGPETEEVIAELWETVRAERRPVVLAYSVDHQHAVGTGPSSVARAPRSPVAATPVATIDAVVSALEQAERPLFVVGRGASHSGAVPAIGELADRTGAAVGTTLQALGALAGRPGALGIVGGYASPRDVPVLRSADCVIAFGASLNQFTADQGHSFAPDVEVICIDLGADEAQDERGAVPARRRLRGDAAEVARSALERLGPQPEPVWWASLLAEAPVAPPAAPVADGAPFDPDAVCARIDQAAPAERTVVTDSSRSGAYAVQNLRIPDARSLMHMQDFLAVGGGLGAAIGAAIGRPGRLTVLVIGDGGMLMTLGDLRTVAACEQPLLLVVLDDSGFGTEAMVARHARIPPEDSEHGDFDFVGAAVAAGVDAVRLGSLDELDGIVRRVVDSGRPLLLECRISIEHVPRVYEHLLGSSG
ncbi:MAG TPA: thiamine pyrophosphate-binding protein [Microbacteriaceae bacterium]|nr:thiamine pyrophosphate-binding protein [Microbacteriaceae bacterium]